MFTDAPKDRTPFLYLSSNGVSSKSICQIVFKINSPNRNDCKTHCDKAVWPTSPEGHATA